MFLPTLRTHRERRQDLHPGRHHMTKTGISPDVCEQVLMARVEGARAMQAAVIGALRKLQKPMTPFAEEQRAVADGIFPLLETAVRLLDPAAIAQEDAGDTSG